MELSPEEVEQFFRYAYIAVGFSDDGTLVERYLDFRHEYFEGKLEYQTDVNAPHILHFGHPLNLAQYEKWVLNRLG